MQGDTAVLQALEVGVTRAEDGRAAQSNVGRLGCDVPNDGSAPLQRIQKTLCQQWVL